MKTYLSIATVFLLVVFCASCNGQEKAESPVEKTKQTESIATAVDPYFVETETTNSLYGPTSITRNMIEDRQGNIWFATWEGIIRYDGDTFTNFTNKAGLSQFHAFAALEDSQGKLWFATIGAGVYRYDGKSFTHFTTKEGLVHDRVACFYEDNAGNIWIGTEGGISLYDGSSFRNFTTADGMTNNDVNAIIEDQNGRFWIGTRGEACFYDGINFTKITNDLGSPFTNVRSILKDSKGNIWLGGNDGLWRYDGNSFLNLSKAFVGYIYQDRQGDIWTSSESPKNRQEWFLSRYNSTVLPFQTYSPTIIHKEKGMIFGLLEDAQGGIWFGSLKGVGRYDGSKIERFRMPGVLD